jgi:DNA-binding LytR/AlgR family response regulator
MRVLIIAGDPLAPTALANILATKSDVEHFDSASDVIDALDKLGKNSYDVLLLDINVSEVTSFSPERIGQALDVASRRVAGGRAAKPVEIQSQVPKVTQRQSTRIAIKAKGRILFIDPGDLVTVQAQGSCVLLQSRSSSYLLRESISGVADKLEPYGFIRIHRSVLVNSSFVEEIQPWVAGEHGIRLKGGKEYKVTRTYKRNLRSLAEVWIGTEAFLAE